jgi:nucleoside permease NupC
MAELIWAVIVLVVFVVALVAYLANIVRLVRAQAINGLTLARVVGIFIFPLGVILGIVPTKEVKQ